MCGQFFAIGDLTLQADKFIKDMFVMDSIRGQDSCGMISVPSHGSTVYTLKKAMYPQDFMDLGRFKDLMLKKNEVIIGHNRKASKGAINSTNAHPFQVGNIMGVHNGTLVNQALLPDSKDYKVDSENIVHSIDKIGPADTWGKIHGAAALIWYDLQNATVNLLRNDQRTFYYCYDDKQEIMFGASDRLMMECALQRNGIKYGDVTELPVDTLHTITIDSSVTAKEVFTITKKTLVPFVPPVVVRGVSGGRNPYDYTNAEWYGARGYRTETQKALPSQGVSEIKRIDFRVTSFREYSMYDYYLVEDNNKPGETYIIEDFNKTLDMATGDLATGNNSVTSTYAERRITAISVKKDSEFEWEDLDNVIDIKDTSEGDTLPHTCSWCASPILAREQFIVVKDDTYLCEDCKDEPSVKEYLEEDYVTAGVGGLQ